MGTLRASRASIPGVSFSGLNPDAIAFYAELGDNNTKAWWATNKARYDQNVRGPVAALAAELGAEFGGLKIFRPYRDVRFSADKTPYKTHIGLVTTSTMTHYLQLNDAGLMTAGGRYDVPPATLARFREIVDDNRLFGDLEATLEEAADDGFAIMTDGSLKTAPRGFSADHPRIELLRLKRLAIARTEEPAEWMWEAGAAEAIAERWRSVSVWNEWLVENLGDTFAE